MNREQIKAKLKSAIHAAIAEEFDRASEILMISLGTTDGFHIKSNKRGELAVDESKISAMSSTLFSLSKGCAELIKDNAVEIASVETEKANFLFLKTDVLKLNCVLSFVTTHDFSLAQARYSAIRLSRRLEDLPNHIVK